MGMVRERAGGPCRGRGLMVRAANSESRECAEWDDMTGPDGMGADGRGVVRGCDEPRRCGGAMARDGAVWFGADRVCRRACGDARVCWCWACRRRRCHRVVTSRAGHGGTQGDTVRRFLLVGGRGGTSWDA
jgi:hypothetical protein